MWTLEIERVLTLCKMTFYFLQNECATKIGVSPLLPCDKLISNWDENPPLCLTSNFTLNNLWLKLFIHTYRRCSTHFFLWKKQNVKSATLNKKNVKYFCFLFFKIWCWDLTVERWTSTLWFFWSWSLDQLALSQFYFSSVCSGIRQCSFVTV